MRRLCLPMLLGCLLASGAAAQQVTPTAALDSLRLRWSRAYDAGDADAMVALYTADAVRMPYDAPAVAGGAAIIADYRAAFANRRMDPHIVLTPAEVDVIEDTAIERGSYHEVLRARQGTRTITEDGKYVAVMRRQPDGSWRFLWSIFNRDAAPPRP